MREYIMTKVMACRYMTYYKLTVISNVIAAAAAIIA